MRGSCRCSGRDRTFAYALTAAAGLTGIIAASEVGFTVVKYAGAACLVYLGIRKLWSARRRRRSSPAPAAAGQEAHIRVIGSWTTDRKRALNKLLRASNCRASQRSLHRRRR
jgi:hypothetical protein